MLRTFDHHFSTQFSFVHIISIETKLENIDSFPVEANSFFPGVNPGSFLLFFLISNFSFLYGKISVSLHCFVDKFNFEILFVCLVSKLSKYRFHKIQ